MTSPRILIINPFGIGDVIFSTPLIQALKERYPESFIGYVCNRRAHEILKSDPSLNRVFIYEKDDYRCEWKRSRFVCFKKIVGFLLDVKKERFDIAIDLSLSYQYSLLSGLIGIRKRVGFNYRNRGRFLTDRIEISGFEKKHVAEYYLDVLSLLGLQAADCKPGRLKVHLTQKDISWADSFLRCEGVRDDDTLIGVIPGCGASWGKDAVSRRWAREKFAQVCDRLIDLYGAKVVLLGDATEAEICGHVKKRMKHSPVMACGQTSLGGLLGIMKRCRLVVTNDGGPLHMAVGLGVKTVSIFGPVDEKIYGPYPKTSDHVIVSKTGMPCRPCYRKFKLNKCQDGTCLKAIEPEEVLAAVQKIIAG